MQFPLCQMSIFWGLGDVRSKTDYQMDCHILDPDIAPEINSKRGRILNPTGKNRLSQFLHAFYWEQENKTCYRNSKWQLENWHLLSSDNLRIDNFELDIGQFTPLTWQIIILNWLNKSFAECLINIATVNNFLLCVKGKNQKILWMMSCQPVSSVGRSLLKPAWRSLQKPLLSLKTGQWKKTLMLWSSLQDTHILFHFLKSLSKPFVQRRYSYISWSFPQT